MILLSFLNLYRASSDGDAACKVIIDDITSRIPRVIEAGFGPAARHMTFENALLRIGDKLGRNLYLIHSIDFLQKKILLFNLENKYHAYSVFFSLLKQEIRSYNELLDLIHTTSDDLRRALIGETVVSEILEETQRTLLMHEIPLIWKVCCLIILCFVF